MKLEDVLKKYAFPPEAHKIFLASGIQELYPPQADAIKEGILEGKNLLMSVPTAAGKTLIAELCMLRSILLNQGRCLYIAPLKALASEKYNDFKNKYSPLGIQAGIAIGDLDTPSHYLNRYQMIIATAEKIDSLLRSRAKWLIDALSVVVLDEIHFINDASRGPTMEILTARIRQLNPKVQILALSATVSNAKEMAEWLKAELVTSSWRPIPLKEGVYFNERIIFNHAGTRLIGEEPADDMSKLALDTLRGKGQVLIFVNSRRSAQAVSRDIASNVSKILTADERKELNLLSKRAAGAAADATKICRKLADVITQGVAFHHAGLKPHQRDLIETHFKNNLIKVICSTPTLAAGVNLPAQRAVIRDCKRFESGSGSVYIPTSEYKQCAGRAGRPQYDSFGEAVLVAKSFSETEVLFERYIRAAPEPIISKLANESVLRIHILASIAGGYVHDVKGMLEFISHTFFYHQRQESNILNLITNIFEFLHKEKFIEKSGYHFFPTTLGSLTSRLYIDPMTTITIRDGLKRMPPDKPFPTIGLLHLMCSCPDNPLLNVSKKDMDDLERFTSEHSDELILNPENYPAFEDVYSYLATIKTTWLLLQWIEEEKEEFLCDQFNVGPGDVYRHVETTQWLLYAAGSIAQLFRHKKLTFQLESLRNRVRYGIKEELLELTRLKGIGRVRARSLFTHGFKKLADLKHAPFDKIASLPHIGKTIAQDILAQIAAKQ